MNHLEYINVVKDANVAFVFIHGIVGSPNHFDDFIPLVPDSYSVYNILLDGHGKSVGDFAKSSMKKWQNQINDLINKLENTYDNIYIVAHSLGTLLSFNISLTYKKIKGMFFLATPLKIILKPSMVLTSLKIYINKIKPTDIKTLEAKRCYSINHSYNILKYLGWIPRFIELFKIAKQTRKITPNIEIPTYIYMSNKDEVVSRKSLKYLNNSNFKTFVLKNSQHFYYDKFDKVFLLNEFNNFIKTTRNT